MRRFSLVKEFIGYATAPEITNTDPRYLVSGSQNVLVDRQRKVSSRQGYTRLGAGSTDLSPVRQGVTWNTSTGHERPVRFQGEFQQVYLGTVDDVAVNAWTQVSSGWDTVDVPRFATWYKSSEAQDVLLWVNHNDNLYEWSGGVAIASGTTSNTITKSGTTTFAQNRFYANANRTLINVRTQTEFTYTGGAGTDTLTGVSPDPTSDIIAGDTLIQKIVTTENKPAANRINDTLFVFENQAVVGSFSDNLTYISQNDDYTDFSFSAPRVPGEGQLLTLDGPSGGYGVVTGSLIAFAGRSSIYKAKYQEITVGAVLTETLTVDPLKTGVNQSSQSPDCVVPVGNSLIYLTYEPALRVLDQSQLNFEPDLKTLSNPVKPDFDAETWTNAHGIWYKNAFYLLAPSSSKMYILEYQEDADGKLQRFWQPPQLIPGRAFSIINSLLHVHSNGVPETYELFNGYSDIVAGATLGDPAGKVPINAVAVFAYNDYKYRDVLKNFDEYQVEGEIGGGTEDLLLTLNYDYGGHTQTVQKTINGTDEDILQENIFGNSLGQISLGQAPLGGVLVPPEDARKFRVIFDLPREDFHIINAVFSTNEVDRFFSILAHGPNAVLSVRRDVPIHK